MRLRNARRTSSPEKQPASKKARPTEKPKRRTKKKQEEKKRPTEEPEKQDQELFFISTEPSQEEGAEDPEEEGQQVGESGSEEEEADQGPSSSGSQVLSQENARGDGQKQEGKYSEQKEKFLEKFLFGKDLKGGERKIQSVESSGSDDDDDDEEAQDGQDEAVEDDDLVPKDKFGDRLWGEEGKAKKKRKKKAAWTDKEDEGTLVKDVTATFAKARGKHGEKETSTEQYSKALKRKYLSIVGTPKWAELDNKRTSKEGEEEDDSDSDEEFFRETTDMLHSGRQASLSQGHLEYRKLKDLNHFSHNEGAVIRTTEFHPSSAVALVAGLSGTASLFKVDGRLNPKIQTVNFENFPVKTAHFSADGREFIVGSQHFGHFYVYDMQAGRSQKVDMGRKMEQGSMQRFEVSPAGDSIAFLGRFGDIHFMNAKTKDRTFSFKMNDDVTAVAFSPDGQELYSHGAGGEVYLWDVRSTRSCVHRFVDDGCVSGTALAVSADHRFLATGADSGVVNVYDRNVALASTRPQPMKILLNLTTSVGKLKFNPTSEILAISSEMKENAIKLVHVTSRTVFANFPSWNFNLARVNCFDFSTNGGYFSVGNNKGAANLYRLKHFGRY